MRTLLILLLSLSACGRVKNTVDEQLFPGLQSPLADVKATEKLSSEIVRLESSKPVKPLTVIVINEDIFGWWDAMNRRIYILNKGDRWNVKTLRHEWEHARQWEAGEPYDEQKAYNAELEEP